MYLDVREIRQFDDRTVVTMNISVFQRDYGVMSDKQIQAFEVTTGALQITERIIEQIMSIMSRALDSTLTHTVEDGDDNAACGGMSLRRSRFVEGRNENRI